MKLSDHGLAVIKNFEGLRLSAYRDVAGVWTIGYGSTRYVDGKAIKPGDKLSNEAQADALIQKTLENFTGEVNRLVKVPLTQNQFDALVSFTYNIGTHGFETSTALKLINVGDLLNGAAAMQRWNKVTDPKTGEKVISQTLDMRRAAERALFMK